MAKLILNKPLVIDAWGKYSPLLKAIYNNEKEGKVNCSGDQVFTYLNKATYHNEYFVMLLEVLIEFNKQYALRLSEDDLKFFAKQYSATVSSYTLSFEV